jgi:2-isopropylmalate synthase
LTGEGVQANKAIVGRNAFAHEAGIHQDGMLKDRRTYEIMRPEDVGVPATDLVLGKHSGRHALSKRVEDLGFVLTKEELDDLCQVFTSMADNKKGMRNGDIAELIRQKRERVATGESVPVGSSPAKQ